MMKGIPPFTPVKAHFNKKVPLELDGGIKKAASDTINRIVYYDEPEVPRFFSNEPSADDTIGLVKDSPKETAWLLEDLFGPGCRFLDLEKVRESARQRKLLK